MTASPLLPLLLALAGAAPAPAAPHAVRVRLEKAEVRLGEPFALAIEIRHREGERYAFPADARLAPFRLLGGACPRRAEGGDAVTTCTLRLALFELGRRELPELHLGVETPEGARRLRVPGPSVTGLGIVDPAAPPEALALKDLAAPAPLLVWNVPLALAGGAALLLGGGAWLGGRAWRRRARRGAEPPPPLPPHERLARQLDALAQARLAEQGRAREHFFRLSEHVREYLGAVTGQPALELTSAELLARLDFQPNPRLDLPALRAFLETSDLVKFARAAVGPREADDGVAFARSLLARTRPAPDASSSPHPSRADAEGRGAPEGAP